MDWSDKGEFGTIYVSGDKKHDALFSLTSPASLIE